MGATHALFLNDPNGVRLVDLNGIESLDCTRVASAVGWLTLTLPYSAVLYNQFQRDGIIEFWRAAPGASLALFGQTVWLLAKRRRYYDAKGAARVDLGAVCLNDLLRRRIVAYAAASSQGAKSGPGDNVSKAIVRENLGSLATASRQIAALTVQADLSLAPTLEKKFSWRNVLTVLQELAAASYQNGTYLAFDVVCSVPPNSGSPFAVEFRTYIGQRGNDHRNPSGTAGAVTEGSEFGTVINGDYEEDWSVEANYAWAAGQGLETSRTVKQAGDAARYGASPFALTEVFVNASQETSPAAIQNEADAAVWAHRPRKVFNGTQSETTGVQFGREIDFGDFLTVQHFGQSFDCRMDAVRLKRKLATGEELLMGLRSDQ